MEINEKNPNLIVNQPRVIKITIQDTSSPDHNQNTNQQKEIQDSKSQKVTDNDNLSKDISMDQQRDWIHESVVLKPNLLAIIRTILFLITFIYTVYYECIAKGFKLICNLKFFTKWGQMSVFIFEILWFIDFLRKKFSYNSWKTSSLWKYIVLIYNLSFSFQFTICIMYWIILFPQATNFGQKAFQKIMTHGVFGSFQVFELAVNKIIFKKCNFFLALITGGLYFCCNFIIYTITDTQIYAGLTFNNVITILYLICGTILIITGFTIGNLITKKCKKLKVQQKKSQKQLKEFKQRSNNVNQKNLS